MRTRTGGAWLATFVGLALGLAAPAGGHDSLAPRGSGHNWLPDEPWVHEHWIPFDERQLERELGLTGSHQLEAYLYDDHRTLAALAVSRGLSVDELVTRLLAPWGALSPDRHAVLADHARRILTQGHLAQHVFFHVFHGVHLNGHARELFGLSPSNFRMKRVHGWSIARIARLDGRSLRRIRADVLDAVSRDLTDGVVAGQAWPAQADRQRRRVASRIGCWLRRPPASRDPANPYGKNLLLHGAHAAGWPRTAAERRADERRAERGRRSLPRSCWPLPPAWDGAARAG